MGLISNHRRNNGILTENMRYGCNVWKMFRHSIQMIIRDDELLHELVHEDIDIEMEGEDDI